MSRTLLFVLYPRFQLLDVAGPVAAFEAANDLRPDSYALHLVSQHGGALPSSSGLSLPTEAFADWPAQAHEQLPLLTLLTVGGHGINAASEDPANLAFLQAQAPHAERIASVCSGTFLLAAAGLLEGKTVTTHWRRSQDFRRRFPEINLQPDRIYVNDGHIWSSAGITAGIDLALALIAADLGEEVARQVARQLVVYYRRPGGQSQHSALLEMSGTQGHFAELLDYIRHHLDQPLTVENLAARACMSPRHFSRSFTADTGSTPARAVERLRLEAATALLEAGHSIQSTARQCGFGTAETLRRAFIRQRGVPPSAVKRG
jgi:transcriptional regulator GlxA family with amidase domain